VKRLTSLILFAAFLGAFLVSAYLAAQSFATYKIAEKLNHRLKKVSVPVSYGKFCYLLGPNDFLFKNLKVELLGKPVTVSRLRIDLPFSFRKKGIPSFTFVEGEGLSLPLDLPVLRELSTVAGVKGPFLNGNFKAGFNFSGPLLTVSGALSLERLADLGFVLKLSGIDRNLAEKFAEKRVPFSALLRKGKLVSLTVVYRDKGFFPNFVEFAAKQEGANPYQVKAELVRNLKSSFKENPEFARRLGYALLEFVANPKCLKLELKPRVPVPLEELKRFLKEKPKIDALMKLLNLRAAVCG